MKKKAYVLALSLLSVLVNSIPIPQKMENFSVEIVSQETVRPSSPTPSHLRIYNLSLLDQLGPLIYVPITLFYSNHDTDFDLNQAVAQLKDSLSETLLVFYPLAGRIRDHVSIDCNDEGVLFSVSTVKLHLQEYLKNPKLDLLHHFVPRMKMSNQALNSAVQVVVQVNIFSSGGFAIGLRFLHRIADANTIGVFLRVWAGIASVGINSSRTKLDFKAGSINFPPLPEMLGEDMNLFDMNWMRKKEKSVRSRVVFDSAAISALKARTAEEGSLANPTRFEVVTSLIWKHALAASVSMGGSDAQHYPSMMMVAVNLRPRTTPPMDENSIGSNVWMALAHLSSKKELEISSIGGQLREAVTKLATDLVGDKEQCVQRQVRETKRKYCDETPDVYTCTSWCAFPFYEVDFGWGKPEWVTFTWRVVTNPCYMNGIVLIDNKLGDGVEAWLRFGENHTATLLRDSEFLSFASVNPSIEC